jgi:CYTH domain-containing protein
MNQISSDEDERKWIAKNPPDDLPSPTMITQHYVFVEDNREFRVRHEDGVYTAAVKIGRRTDEESRQEVEFEISKSIFRALRAASLGTVKKFRYDLGDGMVLDEFISWPFQILEIEGEARDVPVWAGEEVTGSPEYHNAILAINDAPQS